MTEHNALTPFNPADDAPRHLRIRVPRLAAIPGGTAVVGAATTAGALSRQQFPLDDRYIWPLVVLIIAVLAYDLGLRALRRRNA
ncbi:hypothetical protein ACIA8O_38650 [Kitasatospora sp. NPDC051853]|uniref:hypothetical protein n=1 Tax=Kitasatospora sp. NPDC051853 TaxID=3364058 RepID=UPI0037A95A9F